MYISISIIKNKAIVEMDGQSIEVTRGEDGGISFSSKHLPEDTPGKIILEALGSKLTDTMEVMRELDDEYGIANVWHKADEAVLDRVDILTM